MDFRQSESKCNRTAKREARTKTKNSQRNWPLLCKRSQLQARQQAYGQEYSKIVQKDSSKCAPTKK